VRLFLVTALVVSLLLACNPPAASAQGVVITQSVDQTQTIDRTVVEQLPAIEQQVSFLTGHGNEQATYTGALLWSVLERSEALSSDPRTRLRRTVAVTGRDGYMAVLGLAEIDPEFAGKRVILAYRRDGQPLPGDELRLVVPGDRRGGRSVRDVVKIELH
jgi:hypothetical protein